MFAIDSSFSTLRDMQRALDRALDSGWFGNGLTSRGAYPAVNLLEDADNYYLAAELPGMKKEDVRIELKDRILTLGGERKEEWQKDEKISIHRSERAMGRFSRSITIPEKVNTDIIEAHFSDGMLQITMPKVPEAKPRSISIS